MTQPAVIQPRWSGDYLFVLEHLIVKDFKIRYRNMSLGVFWSLLNPLVMMGLLTFVFTKILANTSVPHFGLFVLAGLVPYNFFTIAWLSGTTSLVDNSWLLKQVTVPREIFPLAAVLSNCLHLAIQLCLLLGLSASYGLGPNLYWLWLPGIWICEIAFVCGLALASSGINVYIRDTRYVVESANLMLFWLVPIFYPFSVIPERFHDVYQLNPIAALVMASRNILLDGKAPSDVLMIKLALVSIAAFIAGLLVFRRLRSELCDYL